MFFRFLLSSLKKHHIYFRRSFRINSCVLNEIKGVKQSSEVNKDAPIKYSTSKAAKWKAKYSTSGKDYYETPRIQSPSVCLSLSVFMIYFCMLREENDLDDWLKELEVTIPIQLEETQLRAEIENGKKRGIDVRWQETKLKELIDRKQKIMSK